MKNRERQFLYLSAKGSKDQKKIPSLDLQRCVFVKMLRLMLTNVKISQIPACSMLQPWCGYTALCWTVTFMAAHCAQCCFCVQKNKV